MTQNQRIQFLDIMRGVAVVVMVLGHSIDAVLSVDARTTEAFRLYDAVRGFTAPIFLFVAGCAFTIITERRWEEYRTFSRSLRNRLLKIIVLVIVGYALHLPYFSLHKLLHETKPEEYAQLFQVDVLHCVAAGILILQAFVFMSRTPVTFHRIVVTAASLLVLVTPFIWSVDVSPQVGSALAPYFNQTRASIFPVFPYSAFMFAGVVFGHLFLKAQPGHTVGRFFRGVFMIALGAAVCGIVFDLIPLSLYPPHDYWKTSPNFFLLRLSAVLIVTTGFFHLGKLPSMLERPVLALGQASLLVYAVHLVMVYGSAANVGLTQVIDKTLPYYAAAGVGIAVLCGMIMLTYAWNYLRTHHTWSSRFVQAGFVSVIIYLFITNPW